ARGLPVVTGPGQPVLVDNRYPAPHPRRRAGVGQIHAGTAAGLPVGRVETLPNVIGEQGARPPQPPLPNLPGSPPGHVADLALNASPCVIPAPNAGGAASTGALAHGNPSGWTPQAWKTGTRAAT